MRTRTILAAIIGAGTLLTGAVAQQEEHQSTGCGNMAGMACCSNMPGMSEMMPGNGETAKLVDQLSQSLAAIEAEKDPAALQQKLAAHGALLKELQTKLQTQAQMMHQHMGGMMTGGDHKP